MIIHLFSYNVADRINPSFTINYSSIDVKSQIEITHVVSAVLEQASVIVKLLKASILEFLYVFDIGVCVLCAYFFLHLDSQSAIVFRRHSYLKHALIETLRPLSH